MRVSPSSLGRGGLLCGALVGLLAACSGDEPVDADGDGIADGIQVPNNVTVVVPTRPTGYVAGEVRDAVSGEGLAGVRVSLFGGGVEGEATTGDDGSYAFGPIAAGAGFSLRFARDGYARATLSGLSIDDAAGNFPTQNGALFAGILSLLPTTGSFAVQVFAEDGLPVSGAAVTVETAAGWFHDGAARGSGHGTASTDGEGLGRVSGLPDVFALPPRLENAASLLVHVAPVDLDGDRVPDLDGQTVAIDGRQARTGGRPPVVVLRRTSNQPLRVVASNIAALTGAPAGQPSILDPGEGVRVVFNKPIAGDNVAVDLRSEDGEQLFPTRAMTVASDTALILEPTETLQAGRKYNLAVRVQSAVSTPAEILTLAAPFFVRDGRDQPITVTGRFVDADGDGLWGTGPDQVRMSMSTPLGRAGATPPFRMELWLELDLDGSSVVGDAQGELPRPGGDYPAPLVLIAQEPTPGNGAPLSGFTRYVAPYGIGFLPTPLTQAAGSFSFEARFPLARNDAQFVTTPSGRRAPERFTGTVTLGGP